MPRPEDTGPPELFYNEAEARKYTSNTRIIEVQQQMSSRAVELLALPEDTPSLILDLGCGSGLSGEILEEEGHFWVGCDISKSMLDIAVERDTEGDMILSDLGQGVGMFRPGMFDGAISISALQWLCNSNTSSENPFRRLTAFFTTLYFCLKRNAKVVLQFYPDSPEQAELITRQATKAGFNGGLMVDFPNSSKAKKVYLVLSCGDAFFRMPNALGTDPNSETCRFTQNERVQSGRVNKKAVTRKEWVMRKKEKMRKKGKTVANDSKYTARKRPDRF